MGTQLISPTQGQGLLPTSAEAMYMKGALQCYAPFNLVFLQIIFRKVRHIITTGMPYMYIIIYCYFILLKILHYKPHRVIY